MILEESEFKRLLALLDDYGCRVVERERHEGDYRATNLVVEFRPAAEQILGEPLHDSVIQVFAAHGFSAGQVAVPDPDRYLPDYFDEVRRKLFNNPSMELDEL